MGECSVCLFSLFATPFGGSQTPDPVATHCGHLFHMFCLEQTGDHRCPKCRLPQGAFRFFRIYPQVSDEVQALEAALETMRLEKSKADIKVESLQNELKLQRNDNEARIRRGIPRIFLENQDTYDDSKCYNCESAVHEGKDCPNPP
ncbi:unnamed protein product [Allacma fusca]|uniref:RING-type domain-containing protein n=1 Tax=Allacma fusca TaxID=39272 RepID=A0A8J2P8K1_9HEXA|nr:unnamed protein product [Allacma fusca]